MTNERHELARRGYAALNAAYKSGDVNDLVPFIHEAWEPDIVVAVAGKRVARAR